MEITILEGCRGTGKSSLSFKLRQRLSETTLINFTGFHADNEEGLKKTSDYYDGWMRALFSLYRHDSNYVFDRFFFSERVFSQLYKNYDFKEKYIELCDHLNDLAEFGVKINIIYLKITDKKELIQRLCRDKVKFSDVAENIDESLKQQAEYDKIFKSLKYNYNNSNLQIHIVDTDGKSIDDIYEDIVEKLKTS